MARTVTSKGHIFVDLDGKEVMKDGFSEWPLDPGRPDHDMLQHIPGMILGESPLSFTSRWIESHQGDSKSAEHLDR